MIPGMLGWERPRVTVQGEPQGRGLPPALRPSAAAGRLSIAPARLLGSQCRYPGRVLSTAPGVMRRPRWGVAADRWETPCGAGSRAPCWGSKGGLAGCQRKRLPAYRRCSRPAPVQARRKPRLPCRSANGFSRQPAMLGLLVKRAGRRPVARSMGDATWKTQRRSHTGICGSIHSHPRRSKVPDSR